MLMLDVDRSVSQLEGGAENAQTSGEQKKIVTRRRAVVNIVVKADINAHYQSTLHALYAPSYPSISMQMTCVVGFNGHRCW